jgi:N-acetylglucosamine-6-phosphate deacetylase
LSLRSISGRDPRTGKGIAVDIEDGRIAAMRPAEVSEPSFLSAGLVDLQVNGFAGIDLNDQDITPERVGRLARILASLGVTTFLPTLITASEGAIVRGLQAIAAARDTDPLLAHMIPFVHVEGPFISPEDGPRGAHPRDEVRAPDIAEFDRWQAASGNLVGMVTLSPHYDGAADFIAAVASQGIHVSIGHTDATPGQVRAAVDAARGCRHIWAMALPPCCRGTPISSGHNWPMTG